MCCFVGKGFEQHPVSHEEYQRRCSGIDGGYPRYGGGIYPGKSTMIPSADPWSYVEDIGTWEFEQHDKPNILGFDIKYDLDESTFQLVGYIVSYALSSVSSCRNSLEGRKYLSWAYSYTPCNVYANSSVSSMDPQTGRQFEWLHPQC